ncbi:Fusaric acid resistance protein family protein (plasmid) [Caballeronia sp. SBC1]|uniref:FUSC family protein n=1 Tax=unclassified Caballeronia TaxID=2646786 RepID=UPI0013E1AF18|nr:MULTISPECIES: FUSC family protein [unclassified Caballeronia]QIE26871.1 Fusaric acid resistance protein family protein [Caballeronia sp. SBC2]QIN63812.1 Fusaric acid resistance protein family protein [Caballeronia sp. SBC1]
MTLAGTLVQIFRAAMLSLGRELAAWKPSRERATFGTQAMLSVALSVALANALHLSNTWWAAISGFAVMQTSFAGSVQRAAHRIIGTLIGAALGTLAGPLIGDRPWLFVPALGVIGSVAVYHANGSRAGYAWVLGGATALMVTYEAHGLVSVQSTALFAALRVAEVAVGTLACLLVASVFHFGPTWYRKTWPPSVPAGAREAGKFGTPSPAIELPSLESSRPTRRLLGLQGALAIAILAALTYVLHLPGFAQAMVTAIAVLILPASLPAGGTQQPVLEKMVHRVAGCLLAGALGVALLPLMHGQAILCMLALSIGVWIGCHVQTGLEGASYVGRQFTIAFIMVFVQDHHWSADPVPALMRLSGILTGIVVLAGVMFATSKLRTK